MFYVRKDQTAHRGSSVTRDGQVEYELWACTKVGVLQWRKRGAESSHQQGQESALREPYPLGETDAVGGVTVASSYFFIAKF